MLCMMHNPERVSVRWQPPKDAGTPRTDTVELHLSTGNGREETVVFLTTSTFEALGKLIGSAKMEQAHTKPTLSHYYVEDYVAERERTRG